MHPPSLPHTNPTHKSCFPSTTNPTSLHFTTHLPYTLPHFHTPTPPTILVPRLQPTPPPFTSPPIQCLYPPSTHHSSPILRHPTIATTNSLSEASVKPR
ncbi:hypothetical protein Pcinc_030033 [Petrolisthes cinctipes]|uniref:Uncharacterized protein n=1 Tax=Petrolisthes cinctipes TaxID=88211 RepID=A0AAE1EZ44_PETCI|nr:hypothetical protein Pcinc_030033 [Petrolisthes cinctipes]